MFLTIAREPREEGATRIAPHDLGGLLGFDRASEVKTIWRKLTELAARKTGSTLVTALATRHAAQDPEAMGCLYFDGHVRVYLGTWDLQKAHVTKDPHLAAGHARDLGVRPARRLVVRSVRRDGGQWHRLPHLPQGQDPKRARSRLHEQTFVEDDVEHRYHLADRGIRMKLSKKVDGAKMLQCRQVTRRRGWPPDPIRHLVHRRGGR